MNLYESIKTLNEGRKSNEQLMGEDLLNKKRDLIKEYELNNTREKAKLAYDIFKREGLSISDINEDKGDIDIIVVPREYYNEKQMEDFTKQIYNLLLKNKNELGLKSDYITSGAWNRKEYWLTDVKKSNIETTIIIEPEDNIRYTGTIVKIKSEISSEVAGKILDNSFPLENIEEFLNNL